MYQGHNLRSRLGVVMVMFSALLGIQSGILFLFVFHEQREYHSIVSGVSWPDLSIGMQTVIYGILKIVGGGFMAFGAGMACLVFPIARGDNWARCCALCLSAFVWLPTLYACFVFLDVNPASNPPVLPALMMFLLPVAGTLLSYRPAISDPAET
ncbi:hypothetical protein OAA19_00235 [Rubripirellula sp.]|nr:hypothetical protein [Rubripirellula sp.]